MEFFFPENFPAVIVGIYPGFLFEIFIKSGFGPEPALVIKFTYLLIRILIDLRYKFLNPVLVDEIVESGLKTFGNTLG